MKLKIPQIPIEQRGTAFTNDNYVYYNFYQSPRYGGLNRKHEDYNERHIFMNTLLRDIYSRHALIFSDNGRVGTHAFSESHYPLLFLTETLIYWIRKNMDEMIGMNYYACYFAKVGTEPKKLAIASIGTLINKPTSDVYAIFREIIPKMERINEISNTYKHSFLTSEAHNLYNPDEPAVNCLDLNRNNANNEPVFHSHFLKYIIADYCSFFELSRNALKNFRWQDGVAGAQK